MAVLEIHKKPEYRRWIKLLKGLYLVKDALCPYVEGVLDDFHQNVLKPSFCADCCLAPTLPPELDKGTKKWSLRLCIHRSCARWLDRIAAEHVQYPTIRKDMFKLCDVTELNSRPWEIAKAFLSDVPQAQSKQAAAELDPYYFMRMIKDCKLFATMHAEVEKVLKTRNRLAHSAVQGIDTDAEVTVNMDEMIELARRLPLVLLSTVHAIADLEKVRDGNIGEIAKELTPTEVDKFQLFLRDAKLGLIEKKVDECGATVTREAQVVGQNVQAVGQKIKKDVQAVGQKVEEGVQAVGQKVEESVQAVGQKIKKDVQAVGQKVEEGVQAVGQKVEEGVQAVGQKVEEGVQAVGQKVEEGVQAVGQKVEQGGATVAHEVHAVWQKMEALERVIQTLGKRQAPSADDSSPKKSKQDDTMERLKVELADTYLQHYSKLQPVPWSTDVSLPLNLVYQEQTVEERKGARRQHGSSSELKSILELWGEEQSRPGNLLIESRAGTGKSTLCQKLIQAWALRVKSSASQSAPTEAAYPHQEASQDDMKDSRLHQYHLVFFIRVRDLIGGDLTTNLQKNVVHISWKHKDLKECISQNIKQVLLIVDGYDEGNDAQKRCVDGWLKGTDCRGCTLIVTSRPGFYRPTQDKQNPNRTYTLLGLDRAKQQDFARKFDQVMGVVPGKRSASEQLQQFQDQDFLQTPLLLALVCVLASQGQGALPKNVSGLYNQFTEFLSLKAIRGPIHFSNDYVAELLKFLQEIAFKLFKLKKSEITTAELITHVSESDIEKTMDNFCKLGLVQQEITLKGWKNSQTGEFIHQSFLDYFAARYFVSMCKEERSTLLEGMEIQEYMLVLVAGVCGESEEQHRECFGQMLEAWDRAVQRDLAEEKGWCDHSVDHACFLWLTELRDPRWLRADHISAIYRTSDKESDGAGIYLYDSCTASCYRGVIALLDAAHHHTLHDPRHPPCDPATFKLDVDLSDTVMGLSDTAISTAAQRDLLDAAQRYNVQLYGVSLYLPTDCLTRAQCDQLRAVFTRVNQLEELDIIVPSWTAGNIVLQGLNSTSPLRWLSVTCSPSSPRDSPPAAPAADAAEDSWSPRELIDTISRFSALGQIVLIDAESTLSTEHRRDLTRRLSDRRPRVGVEIYDRDSQTGERTRWEMDSESDVDSDTSQLYDSESDAEIVQSFVGLSDSDTRQLSLYASESGQVDLYEYCLTLI